jgi:hypothetical protein
MAREDGRGVRKRVGVKRRTARDKPPRLNKAIGSFDPEAIEVASKHPVARIGTIEVRPFWQG